MIDSTGIACVQFRGAYCPRVDDNSTETDCEV